MDKSLILLLFILSVGSTGLDTIKWDWKKLLSLYIPDVIGFCFVFCLFLLFFGLFWFAIPWWVSHSDQQNSNSDGKNYDTCLQRKSRGDIWEIWFYSESGLWGKTPTGEGRWWQLLRGVGRHAMSRVPEAREEKRSSNGEIPFIF